MALVVNTILTLEITEHKMYQIIVGVLNFDPWPQQQALTQRSMLYMKNNLDSDYAMFMPPTLKKLMGHIALERACVRGCVGHTFCTYCNF